MPDLFVLTSAGMPHSHKTPREVILGLVDEWTAVELGGSERDINEDAYDDDATVGFGAVIEEVKVVGGGDNWTGREEVGKRRSILEIHSGSPSMSGSGT